MPIKILAIDDSKTMRLAIKITFAAEGADVTSVSKGSEAIARARQMGADVVLVDAKLADGEPSGYDVCRSLKQDPQTANIPVLLMVSNQAGIDQGKLTAVGGDGFITKPFDTQELIDKVTQAVAAGVSHRAATVTVSASPAAVAAPAPSAPSRTAVTPPPAANRPPVAVAGTGTGGAAPSGRPVATPAGPLPSPSLTMPAPGGGPANVRPAVVPATRPGMTPPKPAVAVAPAPGLPHPGAGLSSPQAPAALNLAETDAATTGAPVAAALPNSGAKSGANIPIAIPIPFTAADSPTAGMLRRLRDRGGPAADLDPKAIEVLIEMSREIIEQVAWEVIPELAEEILKRRVDARSA